MSESYIGKKDMIIVNDSDLSTSNSTVVHKLLNGGNINCESLILAIENYNDSNQLGIGKRINYAISTGLTYISVLKAYVNEPGSCFIVIGWDSNGKSFTMQDDNERKGAIMSGLSTHVIPKEKICDVVIGSYDKDVLTEILSFKTVDDISETSLLAIINTLYNDMLNYISSGNYRGAIELFNYTFKHNKLNEYNYNHKLKAYNKYVDVFVRYILALKDIVIEYNEYVKTKDNDTPTLKKKHLFRFVETEDEIDAIIAEKNKDIINTPIYEEQLPYWRKDMLQNTFYVSEVQTFKELIDYEHMRFNQNGLPYWVDN